MLSYAQFAAKHAGKYKGLSAAAKRARYNQYVVSQRGGNGTPTPTRRRPPTQKVNPRRPRRRGQGGLVSNNAVAQFLRLHQSPFDTDTVGLPVYPSPPSQKVTGWSRGVGACGTTGIGFVLARPVIASDLAGVAYSGPTFTDDKALLSGTGVASVTTSNLPYVTADLSESGVRGRVICCAIRYRYIDQQTKLGGISYPYVEPNHMDMNNATITTLVGKEDYKTCPITRSWTTLMWTPVHRTEMDYYHLPSPPSHANVDLASNMLPLVALIVSTPGNTFEWQYVVHVEYTGVKTGMSKTDNPVSSIGFANVIDKLQESRHALRGAGIGNSGGKRDLRPLANFIADVGMQALRGYAGRGGDL